MSNGSNDRMLLTDENGMDQPSLLASSSSNLLKPLHIATVTTTVAPPTVGTPITRAFNELEQSDTSFLAVTASASATTAASPISPSGPSFLRSSTNLDTMPAPANTPSASESYLLSTSPPAASSMTPPSPTGGSLSPSKAVGSLAPSFSQHHRRFGVASPIAATPTSPPTPSPATASQKSKLTINVENIPPPPPSLPPPNATAAAPLALSSTYSINAISNATNNTLNPANSTKSKLRGQIHSNPMQRSDSNPQITRSTSASQLVSNTTTNTTTTFSTTISGFHEMTPSQISQNNLAAKSGSNVNLLHSSTHIPPTSPTQSSNIHKPKPTSSQVPALRWQKVAYEGESPPKPLRAHTMNLIGDKLYIFGGSHTKSCSNKLYVFDTEAMYWSHPKTTGAVPDACRAHTTVAVDKRIYLFGGGDGPTYFNTVYVLDTETMKWDKPSVKGDLPGPRRAHTTWQYQSQIFIYAGGDGVKALDDIYTLNIADPNNLVWSRYPTKGQIPRARGYHTTVVIGSKALIYGGADGHECFGDFHILDMDKATWSPVPVKTLMSRLSHTCTRVGSYLFIMGGHDGSVYSNDLLCFNLLTMAWEPKKIVGTPPKTGRGYHAAALVDSRLFLFGGYDGERVFDDLWYVELSGWAYLSQITDFEVCPKS